MKVFSFFALVALVLGAILGWAMNVVALFGMFTGPVTTLFIARIAGVFVAPLGSVLGLFF